MLTSSLGAALQVGSTVTPTGMPSDEFSIPEYVVYILGSLLVVVALILIGCMVVGVGLLVRRRSLHRRAKSDSRCRWRWESLTVNKAMHLSHCGVYV